MTERISDGHNGETPDVYGWRRSLRSPSPGGTGRRSPSPGHVRSSRDRIRTRSRSPKVKVVKSIDGPLKSRKSTVANGLRKSMTADLSMSGKVDKSSVELNKIEAEYIKNLQQQIYFLELEANYLREQARKATEIHPQMTQEAENMLSKLRELQSDMDKMDLELKRKDSSINVHTSEKYRLEELLQLEKDNRARDKRLYSDELVTLKKEKDKLQSQLMRRDEQLMEAKSEVEKSVLALQSAETRISTLRAQLDQRIEQHNLTQLALEEKRTELSSSSNQLRELEEKFLASTVNAQDKLSQDLRNEIRVLHQKVKESELSAEKDRFLRDKVTEDMTGLVQENSQLNSQIVELSRQLEREKELRDATDQRHSRSMGELSSLRDQLSENDTLRDQLKAEKSRAQQYLEQLTNEEGATKSTQLQLNTMMSQLKEAEGMRSVADGENSQLRKDKTLLVDRVADLTRELEDRDKEIHSLRTNVDSLEGRFQTLDLQKTSELTNQRQKWEEFSRLAESMKNLSQTMMSQASVGARLEPQQY